MLRNLLAERFKLRVHEEMKDAAGYAIILGKNGPKLTPTTGDKPRSIAAFGQPPTELEGMNASMSDLATYFVRQIHRPFVDQTGLTGRYDFRMTLLADDPPPITDAPLKAPPGTRIVFGLNDSALPAVAKALQEQLGLRLEAQKLPTRIIVIDHAEKPSEN
jgi:bla regulator protein blaR1